MAITQYNGIITKIEDIGDNVRHFIVKLDKEIEFKAGQFVNISIEDNGEKYMRPYSIASSPTKKDELEFCIKLIETGKVTPHIFKKKEKDQMIIKGPFGLFTLENSKKDKLVFISTGTGIAPFISMSKYLLETNAQKEIILIYGTKFENQTKYDKEFEKLEKENPNFKYIKIVSRPTEKYQGRIGHVQENLDMVDPQNSEFYICGLQKMIDETKEKLNKKGVIDEFIHHEKY